MQNYTYPNFSGPFDQVLRLVHFGFVQYWDPSSLQVNFLHDQGNSPIRLEK